MSKFDLLCLGFMIGYAALMMGAGFGVFTHNDAVTIGCASAVIPWMSCGAKLLLA